MADNRNRFLSEAQAALLTEVLDTIVPGGDGFPGAGELGAGAHVGGDGFPGAGELGVGAHVDGVVGASTALRGLFSDGLPAIEIASSGRYSRHFGELTGDERLAVLKGVEAERPAFFHELVRHTYAGYYATPRIMGLLGLEQRAPQPLGYDMEPFDPSLVENVKRRGKVYRDA